MIYNKIKLFRESKNLSQSDLASLIGVSRSAISDFENQKYQPNIEHSFLIAYEFDIDINDLFDLTYLLPFS